MTGLDTETHNGKAVLVSTPLHFIEPWSMVAKDRFLEICEWLRKLDKEGFVCWNADYDVQAILKWLPRVICERLERFSRARYKGLRLRFVPGKFFTVHKAKRRLVAIYDLMQFYAMKLETASTKFLGEGKKDPGVPWDQLLRELKKKGSDLRKQILDYCRFDAHLVQRLYEKSRENMVRIGCKFSRPVSCASVSSQKFGKLFSHEIPKEVNRAFEKTFRGGRMECLKLGYFPRAFLYDLHSAYPSVIADLPEIPGCWDRITKALGVREDAAFAAIKASFQIPEHVRASPVSAPGDGQLMYPIGKWEQWIDLQTFRLLEERGWLLDVLGGWQTALGSDRKPFAVIRELYEERQNTPENAWALKIVMNAWYGKLAERLKRWKKTGIIAGPLDFWGGAFWRRHEQWTHKTCFVYASAITAGIRARLFREVDSANVIFYATDGVACTSPDAALGTGPGLGEWSECESITDLLVVGSGVYCYRDSSGKVRTKFRGFDVGLDLYSLLDSRSSIVEMTVKRNVTLNQALIQHKWPEFNEISDVPRILDLNFDRKRRWGSKRTGRDLLTKQFDSKPWRYYGELDS